ncbi:uncharacterized protein F4812DRAFT_458168 [Daldinia caldariorum]|uniref:uncharacterized protein n=1 Tax=Daldinia caldariorum TaxID=326644 RepID=UPI00200796BB|nr:uncharacterized protein F4812DRAFT_458168 [Daldinia caldariorum]KAI1468641.1 hypothetical protein F4812DRAFT_458168 [Daldinia caldariorum]
MLNGFDFNFHLPVMVFMSNFSAGRQSDARSYGNCAGVSTGLDSLDGPPPTSYGDSFILGDGGVCTSMGPDVDILLDETIQLDDTFESLLDSMNWHEFGDIQGLPDFVRQDTQIVSISRTKTLSHQDYSKMSAVCDNSTLCMHRHLYLTDTPSWILHVFSTCVLYANQTEATRGLALKILHKNVHNPRTTANVGSITTRKKLARVRNKPPESWERWLFAESVRRTYMISAALIQFWSVLKGRKLPYIADLGDWYYVHRWTSSRHLWTAKSPLDFYKAWREEPIWIISAFRFDAFLGIAVVAYSPLSRGLLAKPASLEENCAAASVALSADEVARIRALVETALCRGARYPPEHALALFADTPLPEEYARGLEDQGKVSITGSLHVLSPTAGRD